MKTNPSPPAICISKIHESHTECIDDIHEVMSGLLTIHDFSYYKHMIEPCTRAWIRERETMEQ